MGVDGALRIAVDPDGSPWIIQVGGRIYHWKNDQFMRMPGRARDIAVGAEGSVYAIGYKKFKKGYGVWKLKKASKLNAPIWLQ